MHRLKLCEDPLSHIARGSLKPGVNKFFNANKTQSTLWLKAKCELWHRMYKKIVTTFQHYG